MVPNVVAVPLQSLADDFIAEPLVRQYDAFECAVVDAGILQDVVVACIDGQVLRQVNATLSIEEKQAFDTAYVVLVWASSSCGDTTGIPVFRSNGRRLLVFNQCRIDSIQKCTGFDAVNLIERVEEVLHERSNRFDVGHEGGIVHQHLARREKRLMKHFEGFLGLVVLHEPVQVLGQRLHAETQALPMELLSQKYRIFSLQNDENLFLC